MEDRVTAFCCALILALFLVAYAGAEALLSGAPGPAARPPFSVVEWAAP